MGNYLYRISLPDSLERMVFGEISIWSAGMVVAFVDVWSMAADVETLGGLT